MIMEQLKEEATLLYDTTKEQVGKNLERLNLYVDTYQDAEQLGGLDEEDINEMYLPAVEHKEMLEGILNKLNDDTTKDWFLDLILDQIESTVTEEDLENLKQAMKTQDRIDTIFEEGTMELVQYLNRDLD